MLHPPGNKALRKGRRSLKGYYYLLTTTTIDRRPVLKIPKAAQLLTESLHWLENKSFIELDTAVIMPDHLHFVAILKHASLPELMKKFKGYTARKINLLFRKTGPLWQTGYYDHAIRKDESLQKIRLYCLHNPVRAGIVKDYQDYPYWYCKKLPSKRNECADSEKSRLKAAPTKPQ